MFRTRRFWFDSLMFRGGKRLFPAPFFYEYEKMLQRSVSAYIMNVFHGAGDAPAKRGKGL